MKFISLTTVIMSAVVLVGIVKADINPNGGPCAQNSKYSAYFQADLRPHTYGCILFFCNLNNIVETVQMCTCIECCYVVNGGVGDDGYVHCT
ncbi:uncharacterized protein HD556DRAFT_1411587 [Suillus plorans]|uniref:Secreted protein n=1 Tax=Suillus plorans TaxID=116603 RepID=A0A9P7ADA9_9AGAM|nr:uncharacterized protein HD556DRAFT_1411587 [Suillus plorans]KAG1786992.1 hypothetical protein HD556DRAFT_1411587 [Suillus plorans]